MQEHIYTAKTSRILKQSSYIWLFVALHITANVMAVPTLLRQNQVWGVVFINVLLCLITVPSIILFIKYYRHSVGKRFIITYESLKFIDVRTGDITELKNADIDKIYLVENNRLNRLPWLFHEYFSFIDKNKNKITVTSYFMDISDFWLDTLTRRVNSDKLIREEKTYPII